MTLFKSIRYVILVLLLNPLVLNVPLAVAAGNVPPLIQAIEPGQHSQPAQPSQSNAQPSSKQIEEIIQTLQDPAAREKLIQELTVLSQTQQIALPPTPPVAPNQLAITVGNLSKSISKFHLDTSQLVIAIIQGKKSLDQFITKIENAHERNVYGIILLKCLIVIILSYGAFFFTNRWIPHIYRRFARGSKKKFIVKVLNLLVFWFLSLIPIALFTLIANSTLVFLHVGEVAQWLLLAWMAAFIIVKVLSTIYDFFFALILQFPNFLILSDSAVGFLKNWFRLLTALIVYGYFILQVALFLGVSLDSYEALNKLLGFLVVLVLIAFVLRNPLRMIKLIAGRKIRGGETIISPEKIARIDVIFRVVAVVYLFLLYIVWIVRADDFFWFVLKGTILSLILILLAVKIVQFIHRYFNRNFTVSPSLRKRLPGLEQRFRRYRRVLNVVLRTIIYVATTIALIKIWGGQISWLPPTLRILIIIKLISILCIGLAAMLIWEVSNSLIEISLTKSGEDVTLETGRTHTLLTVARRTVLFTLSLIAILMVLSEVGVNIAPLLATAGVLGLAISFGAQKLMTDIITGFLMLLENQIAIGDYVTIGDKSGTVEAIAIRTMSLRDTSGVVHIIPYSSIVTVSNFTKEFSYALFDINVAYRENVDEVINVLRKIAADLQKDHICKSLILESLDVLGLDKFLDSGVVIRARLKTKPGFQWQVGRAFNRRMKQKFDELNIELPFPHRVIYFGEKKDGSAPSAHLQVDLNTGAAEK